MTHRLLHIILTCSWTFFFNGNYMGLYDEIRQVILIPLMHMYIYNMYNIYVYNIIYIFNMYIYDIYIIQCI